MLYHVRVLLLIIIPKIRGGDIKKKGTMKEERNKNRQNEGNQMVTCKQRYVFIVLFSFLNLSVIDCQWDIMEWSDFCSFQTM